MRTKIRESSGQRPGVIREGAARSSANTGPPRGPRRTGSGPTRYEECEVGAGDAVAHSFRRPRARAVRVVHGRLGSERALRSRDAELPAPARAVRTRAGAQDKGANGVAGTYPTRSGSDPAVTATFRTIRSRRESGAGREPAASRPGSDERPFGDRSRPDFSGSGSYPVPDPGVVPGVTDRIVSTPFRPEGCCDELSAVRRSGFRLVRRGASQGAGDA